EQQTHNLEVLGSSPRWPTKEDFNGLPFFLYDLIDGNFLHIKIFYYLCRRKQYHILIKTQKTPEENEKGDYFTDGYFTDHTADFFLQHEHS
ncbi:MAG: hypothetical protein MJZ12_00615, partial [Prevotella sp.]|nr:hypothetical protein [Prevotella sp.]